MARQAIYLLIALDVALVVWGQQTFPPNIVTFPPPPTMTAVINESLVLFVGEPIVVGEDVRVTIDCSEVIDPVIAGGISNPTIRWIKDGAELTGNGSAPNVDISADRRRLIITDTLLAVGGQIGNDGNYTCEVCDNPTDVNCRNRPSCIAVCGFPNIMVPTTAPIVNNFLVSFGCGQDVEVESFTTVSSLIINCEAFNGSEPFVQEIYKDGELLQNGTSLSLLDTSPSDDNFGTYTFALSTEKCGSTTAVSRIIRQADPPDIDEGPFIPQPPTIMPGDMTVTIGTPTYIVDGFDLTVVCDIASGTHPITIMWIRNDVPYPAGGNRSVITIPDTDYEDGDVFFCRADNVVGFDVENTTISVFEPPQVLPIPFPTPPPGGVTVSTGQPANTTITPGTDVTIYCPSSGTTIPSIEWFKDGTMVMSGGRFTISTTTLPNAVITSVLSIDDFQSADAGTYSCTSTNIVGSDDGRTTLIGDVCVDCPPDAFETPSTDPDGCPICGVWDPEEFGPCSLECHLGTMTRNVFCINVADDNRPRVDNSFCDPATEPARSQSCGEGPCASGWRKGPWTKCSRTCETGHQMRMVVCTSMGVVVPDDQCDGNLRPISERFCNGHIDCFPCKDEYPHHCRRLMRRPMGCMGDYARKICCWSCRND